MSSVVDVLLQITDLIQAIPGWQYTPLVLQRGKGDRRQTRTPIPLPAHKDKRGKTPSPHVANE
jgi:hypothetical protein